MKNLISKSLLSFFFFISVCASAHEGMWIPSVIGQLMGDKMQEMGMEITPDQLYAINQSSIKDAIVHFGGGCTAEVISKQGLILTNHHCGYSNIQSHSSLENNYLKDGFWAKNHEGELVNPGLSATFIIKIEDVTSEILNGTENLTEAECESIIKERMKGIVDRETSGNHYQGEVKPFFYGNQYFLILTEKFTDVRLVGAPPSSIGKFGGDTDNWVWPRHTGDFALFRIYAGPDNLPADYNENNIPFTPRYSLPIAMDGVKEGDFTMVYGFPGTTQQYLTSDAVRFIHEIQTPARIEMREKSLDIIDAAMAQSELIQIQYASRQSSISNSYKKWIGQQMGLERFSAIERKENHEKEFTRIIEKEGKEAKEKYGQLLSRLKAVQDSLNPYDLAWTYFVEYYFYGPQIIRFSSSFEKFINEFEDLEKQGKLEEERQKLIRATENHFKNYDAGIDKQIFMRLLNPYREGLPKEFLPETFASVTENYKTGEEGFTNEVFGKTIFDTEQTVMNFIQSFNGKTKRIEKDPVWKLQKEFSDLRNNRIRHGILKYSRQRDDLMKDYVAALRMYMPQEALSPDANSTLRITFGRAEGSVPRDGMVYSYYTTLDGAIEKYVPGSTDFDLPEKLLELHKNKDYGQYATNGEMRVCFLGSNHTTGGNSGSPALDGKGRLIGLNFDRTWESTMSDILFSEEICRNIMVDIKYVLFIIDKFAGASHLIEEMELVYNEVEVMEEAEVE